MPKKVAAAAQTKKVDSAFPAGNHTPHKLASLVPGEMSPDEYKALCTSIKEDGLQNAIVLFDKQILDGRHRYQACRELGITPKFIEFIGTEEQASALVLDNNLHRRTLNSMQKAIVAARMHLREVAPLSQKDAAMRVGVGVATVNLAVRLLNSKNTPLIKRCENGDATRAEIDEILFDRSASMQAETVQPLDEVPDADETPGNVVSIDSARAAKGEPVLAGKASHPERRAQESSPSRVVQHFKGLTEKERVEFVTLAWTWLEPALRKADKLPKVEKHPGRESLRPAKLSKDAKKNYRKAIKAVKATPKAA